MSSLRPAVQSVKRRLAEGYERLRQQHSLGATGAAICAAMSDLRDEALMDLARAALNDLGLSSLWSELALVAHGGYGRRDVAPHSDVDLMLLHRPGAADRVAPLAGRLLSDVFDAGLSLGHSVRTPEQACRLAVGDPTICTSLIQSRFLGGNRTMFTRFERQLRRRVRRRAQRLITGILDERLKEQQRYGGTVFLLEPNVKRTRGGLRDLQLIRWIAYVRYGLADPRQLLALGALGEDDCLAIERASEFLLRLRNELHFHAGGPSDVLDRSQQLRIAELRGYEARSGLLPVERFMRDYFRRTAAVGHLAWRLAAKAQSRDRLARLSTAMFGHRIEPGLHVGPTGILATRRGLDRIRRDLADIARLADLANLYDTPIAPATWESIRRGACHLPKGPPSPEACRHFLSLLGHPARLAPLLRDLHDARLLERFVPEFHRVRGLLQFNQYHKYTVDEHCLRAVEFATELGADSGPLGRVYRPLSIEQKRILHLALLLHDLGKGQLEDHREAGGRIAAETAARLGLADRETDALRFLVHKHMLMNHMAFRRDTADERLAVQLAVAVGSPELLQMLYVMTAADLGAVGPNVWDGWKQEVVTDLYHRAMQHLAGESPETTVDDFLARRRERVRQQLADVQTDPWFAQHIEALPAAYCHATPPDRAAADLRLLHDLTASGAPRRAAAVDVRYLAETDTVEFTIATSERIVQGIFHRLTGALSSRGLEIRAAQIHTLSDGLVLDRFWVRDPDFAGWPPSARMQQIEKGLIESLENPSAAPPTFRRTWRPVGHRAPGVPTRVNIDNSTSDRFTIVDVFTHDRAGLLYDVARALFEMDLSVGRAKIGTFLDQVVDVFYVTDRQCEKILDPQRLDAIRDGLLEVVQRETDAAT